MRRKKEKPISYMAQIGNYYKCANCGEEFFMGVGVKSETWAFKVLAKGGKQKLFCRYSCSQAWKARNQRSIQHGNTGKWVIG